MTEDDGRCNVRMAVATDGTVFLVADDVADLIESGVSLFHCRSEQEAAVINRVLATVAGYVRDRIPVWQEQWTGPRVAGFELETVAPRLSVVRNEERPDQPC